MNAQRAIIAVLGLAAVVLAAFLWLGPRLTEPRVLTGYVESEPLYLASPVAGQVTQMAVARGQRVDAGALLFTIDARSLTAVRDEAKAQIAQARAQMAAAGASYAQLAAAADAARATAEEARREADRATRINQLSPAAIAVQDVDKARAASFAAEAQAKAARRQADAAAAQVGAAKAQLAQAQASRADAEARLSQLAAHAPAAARVEDTFYQTGEWAAANQPAVSLLPDDRITIRFFVPEREVAGYDLGRRVGFACDGCAHGLSAFISYVSPRPEYTPPVIYSRAARDALVYLVEARPPHPERLTPGQPVDVTPLTAEGRP